MTDRLDDRIHGLMQQVIDETPLPPMLPDEPVEVPRASVSGWVVGLATAVIVLVMIGAMSLVFGGSEGSVPPVDTEPPLEVEASTVGRYSYPSPGYGRVGVHDPEMDVYAPSSGGPYPIVVVFHPDPAVHTNDSTAELARRIAETGAVVFNPTWGGTGRTDWELDLVARQGGCALRYAAAHGPEYGGDRNDARVVGIGLGANAAFLASSSMGGGFSVDCTSDFAWVDVTQVIGFDGDYTLSPDWNDALDAYEGIYADSTAWSTLNYMHQYPPPVYDVIIDTATATTYRNIDTYLDLRPAIDDLRPGSSTGFNPRTAWEDLGVIEADEITLGQVSEMMYDNLAALRHPVTYTAVEGTGNGLSEQSIDAIVTKIRDRWDTQANVLAVVDGFTAALNRYDTQAIPRFVTDNFMDSQGEDGWVLDLGTFLYHVGGEDYDSNYEKRGVQFDLGRNRIVRVEGDEYSVQETGRLTWPDRRMVWEGDSIRLISYQAEQKGTMTYQLVETDNGWHIKTRRWTQDPTITFTD